MLAVSPCLTDPCPQPWATCFNNNDWRGRRCGGREYCGSAARTYPHRTTTHSTLCSITQDCYCISSSCASLACLTWFLRIVVCMLQARAMVSRARPASTVIRVYVCPTLVSTVHALDLVSRCYLLHISSGAHSPQGLAGQPTWAPTCGATAAPPQSVLLLLPVHGDPLLHAACLPRQDMRAAGLVV